jgi:hypothetical protein
LTVEYTNVQGGWPGDGNVDADPRFTNPQGIDGVAGTEDDNLRLRWDSPCIDAGDNSAVPPGVTTDLDGKPRFIDDPDTPDTGLGTPPIVDMGAYEFPGRAGDFDGDGDVDLNDFATFALCYTGAAVPPAPGCEPCDLDADNDVDLGDFATFAANFTG